MSDKKEEAKEGAKEEDKKEEKKEGDNKGSGGGAKEKFKNIINTTKPFDKIVTNSEDEKLFYETVRRWKVIIKEIYVISQKRFDCFLNFTIGGDLRIDTFKILEKNRSGKIVHGARGYSEYTELQEILDINTRVKFEKEIHIELRDSIISLSKQNLLIECWDYNTFKLNNFQGFVLIDLMKIIRGSVYQSANILQKVPTGEGGFLNKPLCKVEFQIFFQEIWDFVLSFEDWSSTNLNYAFNVESKELQPSIDFKLSKGKMIKSTVSQKASANPQWSVFDGPIKFRGTLMELENQSLQINIFQNESTIIKRNKISRLTDLKGITINGIIKDFLPQLKINNNKQEELPDSILIGKINVNTIPKYNQMSHETFINLDQIYVCIYFQKLTLNQVPSFCKLPVSTFITVEFNGKTYESYRIPIQINDKKFNQYMYFLLGTPNAKKILEGPIEKRLADIVSHLKTKNEISVKLWIEDSFKCLDYIGKFEINMTDIFEKGKLMERKYKSNDNSEIIYKTKVFSGEDIFEASYEVQGARLKYDLWFYPEAYTKNIELPKEGIKKRFKENPIIEKATESLKLVEEEFFELERNLIQVYQDYQNRFFNFFKTLGKEGPIFHFMDENKNFRLINSYLSKLTVKNPQCDDIFFTADIENMIKKKSQIEKITLPLENEKAMVHYIKCFRYSNAFDHIVLSPEYFMQTKKGSKFEHTILLACLLMNLYSNKKDEEEEKIEGTEGGENLSNMQINPNNTNNNSAYNSKTYAITDGKNIENKPLIDKTNDSSMINLNLDKPSNDKDLSISTNNNLSNIMSNKEIDNDRKMNVTNRSIDNLINNTKNIKIKLNKIQQNVKKKLDPRNLKKLAKKEVAVFDNVILNKFLINK